MSENVELLKRIYDRFNARDMETVLAALHEDIKCTRWCAISEGISSPIKWSGTSLGSKTD